MNTGSKVKRAPSHWQIAHGRSLELGPRGLIMGIVNTTLDSFSDGGRYAEVEAALTHALTLVGEGADIVDIGGESTRPGAAAVSAAEEQDRVLPVIERLVGESPVLISIDTYRAETARLAIAAGAHIVNDVFGLQKDADMAGVVATSGAGVCIMHTGRDGWMNVVTACRACNHRKSDRTPEQAHMPLLYAPYVPSLWEDFILRNRRILADQMEFLMAHVPKSSRLLA